MYRIQERLTGYLFTLVLITLLTNCMLCVFGKADAAVLSERLGAVFYAACAVLIANSKGIWKKVYYKSKTKKGRKKMRSRKRCKRDGP